eukprot:13632945-Alexandrium_andersonii.AAC.1
MFMSTTAFCWSGLSNQANWRQGLRSAHVTCLPALWASAQCEYKAGTASCPTSSATADPAAFEGM